MMTAQSWTYSVVDAYTDEHATDREFSSFEDAVAWAKEMDLDPEQFAIAMWRESMQDMRLLKIPS